MKKTDAGKILYPQGLAVSERRHCRRIIVEVAASLERCDRAIISCSGGIDSTVLVHAVGQAIRIQPENSAGSQIKTTAVYLNHHLRPDEIYKEVQHVQNISKEYLSYVTDPISLHVQKGSRLQERARDARYEQLELLVRDVQTEDESVYILTAHNANDVAETKLFQFLKGGTPHGILPIQEFKRKLSLKNVFLSRPLLKFSREDIERYAKAFRLTWCEDSSNKTDAYTRNKIRHHLIPWIKENVNPGIIKTLSRASGEQELRSDLQGK